MPPVPTAYYVFLSTALFTIGVIGVLTRHNVVIILISIELILNAVNINLVAFSHQLQSVNGQAFAIFVIVDAAAEAAVGLGIIIGGGITGNLIAAAIHEERRSGCSRLLRVGSVDGTRAVARWREARAAA